MKHILLASLFLTPSVALAHDQQEFYQCHAYTYTEKYNQGYIDEHGYYRQGNVSYNKEKNPCKYVPNPPQEARYTPTSNTRNCNGSGTLGGLLGGGLAASLSKKDAYGWSIPLGAVLGAGLGRSGCEQ